jgi:hypothetical protein
MPGQDIPGEDTRGEAEDAGTCFWFKLRIEIKREV